MTTSPLPTQYDPDSTAPGGANELAEGDTRQFEAWRASLGVTADQLEQAVHEVGPAWSAVRDYLATPASGRTS
ncbi:DUF3606 domain-containing protein [Pseudomonadota bacterium AL_CKDN230030165-1A_HGKHYDSX7]